MALAGQVQVGGLSPSEAAKRIEQALIDGYDAALKEIEDRQRKMAAEWALSLYTYSSDNDDVIVPPRPDFIPREDRP